jgi:hypothetical protein
LDDFGRIAVGSACEKRFREIWIGARELTWSNRKGVDELHSLQSEMRKLTPDERRGMRGQELSEEIEQAIRSIRNTPDWVEETNRGFRLTAPRPKGVRDSICRDVATEFSAKWPVVLTPRYVRECWEFYRAFEADTRPTDV